MEQEQNTPEPWVGLDVVAAHLNCHYLKARKLAKEGKIPCIDLGSGKNNHFRFKISKVDAAFQKLQTEAR